MLSDMKEILNIEPFQAAEGIVYHADTCSPLTDAYQRKKVKFKALARHSYPGNRLDENTLGLNSIGYWDANTTQDWGLDWHRNEGIELHFLESGQMPYAQVNKEVVLEPNTLTITRPWEAHKVGNPNIGIGKFYWIIIDLGVRRPHQQWVWPDWINITPQDLERLTILLRQGEKSIIKTNHHYKNCFQKIGKAIDEDLNNNSASKIRILINQLLLLLLESLNEEKIVLNESLTDSSRSVNFFLKELDHNIAENWSIQSMANSAGVGLTRFTHHCKQSTNLTPMQYLTYKRIEKAKKLLTENTELTVSEIAYMCGFTTSQYFATVFKKHENCTPNQYRVKNSF